MKPQNRRVMKIKDFSHKMPSIYVEKPKLQRLARLMRNNKSVKYRTALNTVANIMCGVKKDFSEYYVEGSFDITIHEVGSKYPDILKKIIELLAAKTGADSDYIEYVLLHHNFK